MPTVYADPREDSELTREEIFGPVLAATPANDPEHALGLANDTPCGLSASVFTHDLETATRFARDLRVGIVHVNDESAGAEPHRSVRRRESIKLRSPRAGEGGDGVLYADQDDLPLQTSTF